MHVTVEVSQSWSIWCRAVDNGCSVRVRHMARGSSLVGRSNGWTKT